MAAGPASRLGSIEPGDKTGLRLSPHLAPSTQLDASCRSVGSSMTMLARATYTTVGTTRALSC